MIRRAAVTVPRSLPSDEPQVSAPHQAVRPGLILALIVFCVYGGVGLSVDFPRAAFGIQSDEATYYMMGHSLALDGDLAYRREDLVRVWREFQSGPTGLFLKQGRDIVDGGLMLRPPFVWTTTRPDTDPTRYFYGKSFAYPLFVAPFVRLFGTNGFLVFNALLLAVVALCAYCFLNSRMRSDVALLLSSAFVFASVVPVYFVWIAPELFNLALGVVAYFLWLYKEVAPGRSRWLHGTRSDVLAATLLGIATFSKVTNALLVCPILAWLLWRRQWKGLVVAGVMFLAATIGLFAINTAITGEWNYQGGERWTYYTEFPLQTPQSTMEVGLRMGRDEALGDIMFGSMFWTNLMRNLGYFFVGRYSGLVAYFFPAVFALIAFLVAPRRRPAWQYLVLASATAQILVFVVATPYTWNGGGGSVGNRYFMGVYGLFVFLIPPVARLSVSLAPWAIGGLFVAPLVLNPFVTSFNPGKYADRGPLRLLPVELTLINNLPIFTDESRVRQWFGDNPGQGDPGFQITFFDENAYGREEDKSFWVRGESRAEILIKIDRPMRRLVLTLSAGPVATEVTATVGSRSQHVTLGAGASQQVFFALDDGFRFQGQWPVWVASVSSSTGFVPIFHEPSTDTRYLGVRVKPVLVE